MAKKGGKKGERGGGGRGRGRGRGGGAGGGRGGKQGGEQGGQGGQVGQGGRGARRGGGQGGRGGKTPQKEPREKNARKNEKREKKEKRETARQPFMSLKYWLRRDIDSQHKMRKFVLAALSHFDDDDLMRELSSDKGLEKLALIANATFTIDAGDRKARYSFQTIAVPFCGLLSERIAQCIDQAAMVRIFRIVAKESARFFTLEQGSAISCLIECAAEDDVRSGTGEEEECKYVPSTLEEAFEAVLSAVRSLLVNLKDEKLQDKWPEILAALEGYVPDACMRTFCLISQQVQTSQEHQRRQAEATARAQGAQRRNGALATPSLPGSLRREGPRHDNDRADIRDIVVLPTGEEMLNEEEPYLPRQNILLGGNVRGSEFIADDVDRQLDIQFRLLREDMMAQLRTAVQNLTSAGGLAALKEHQYRFTSKTERSVLRCSVMRNVRVEELQPSLRSPQAFCVSFDNPAPKEAKFWASDSCRLLSMGQLVLLLFTEAGRPGLIMATVCGKVEAPPPVKDNRRTRCSLLLEPVHCTQAVVSRLLGCINGATAGEVGLVEVSGVSVFAYAPVLRSLQRRVGSAMPFLARLVPTGVRPECCAERLPGYIRDTTRLDLTCLVREGVAPPSELHEVAVGSFTGLAALLARPHIADALRMDATQAKAFAASFTRDVALVQGPPGTGKTFVGVEVLRALLHNSGGVPDNAWAGMRPPADEVDQRPLLGPIMLITFTNHALDQLLEHLLNAGIVSQAEIVRLGGRTKSAKLENCNMYSRQRAVWEKSDGWRKGQRKDQLQEHAYEIERLQQLLQARRNGGKEWMQAMFDMLAKEEPDICAEAQMLEKHFIAAGGINVDNDNGMGLWRKENRQEWQELEKEMAELHEEELLLRLKECKKEAEAADQIQTQVQLRAARNARVIGMTTTGCAMHSDLVLALKPRVIMCEEAGEVLESHILAAITSKTESLILIGDHQQLRPKPAEFSLSVESQLGYDLDISLFERLINANAPQVLLEEQRRMQPEIADLLRRTLYPRLKDHPTVAMHPPLRGIERSLLFLDHSHPEHEAADSSSKKNAFEVDMAAALVEYFVRNGYRGETVAVLTPYLGQLRAIRAALGQRKLNVFIDDLTREDLLKEGVSSDEEDGDLDLGLGEKEEEKGSGGVTVERLKDCVRLSTVDNFQGEEADLVLVSTVRCNANGTVGFLKTDNRVNVMLSRARHGMIVLGSRATVMKRLGPEPTMFQQVLTILEERGALLPALPLRCEQHPGTVTLAATAAAVPGHGGCTRPCGARLSCGHRCRSACHPDNRAHQSVDCAEECVRILDCGHACARLCSSPCACATLVTATLPCGHRRNVPCEKARRLAADPSSCRIVCKETVALPPQLRRLPCGHELERAPCHVVNSGDIVCEKECGAQPWPCGHACVRRCSECMPRGGREDHGACRHPCGRVLLCGHNCTTAARCHTAAECPPCGEPCAVRCAHSGCALPCREPCSPCAEKCVWRCTVDHAGANRCELPCAAPCVRPPCDVRCDQVLPCGHGCPSLCGEVCPVGACPQCASAGVTQALPADTVVDYLSFSTLADHEVSGPGDALLQLACGHVFTAEYLDEKLALAQHYARADGAWGPAQPWAGDGGGAAGERHRDQCDHCQQPLLGPRRYGRPSNWRALHLMDVKWDVHVQREAARVCRLVEGENLARKAVRDAAKAATALQTAARGARWSPMELCVRPESGDNVPATAATRAALARARAWTAVLNVLAPRLARAHHIASKREKEQKQAQQGKKQETEEAAAANAFHAARQELTTLEDIVREACRAAEEGMCQATRGISRSAREGLARGLARLLSDAFDVLCLLQRRTGVAALVREAKTKAVDAAEWLEGLNDCPPCVAAAAEDLRRRLRNETVSAEEMRQIREALRADVGGHVGSYGGHWYECPNGHPYAIGECGGAMEESKCPECGETIGGRSHRLASGNRAARDFLAAAGGEAPEPTWQEDAAMNERLLQQHFA